MFSEPLSCIESCIVMPSEMILCSLANIISSITTSSDSILFVLAESRSFVVIFSNSLYIAFVDIWSLIPRLSLVNLNDFVKIRSSITTSSDSILFVLAESRSFVVIFSNSLYIAFVYIWSLIPRLSLVNLNDFVKIRSSITTSSDSILFVLAESRSFVAIFSNSLYIAFVYIWSLIPRLSLVNLNDFVKIRSSITTSSDSILFVLAESRSFVVIFSNSLYIAFVYIWSLIPRLSLVNLNDFVKIRSSITTSSDSILFVLAESRSFVAIFSNSLYIAFVYIWSLIPRLSLVNLNDFVKIRSSITTSSDSILFVLAESRSFVVIFSNSLYIAFVDIWSLIPRLSLVNLNDFVKIRSSITTSSDSILFV